MQLSLGLDTYVREVDLHKLRVVTAYNQANKI